MNGQIIIWLVFACLVILCLIQITYLLLDYSCRRRIVNRSLRAVNETISDAVLYFDKDNKCIYANKVARKIFRDRRGFSPVQAESYLRGLSRQEEEALSNRIDNFLVEGSLLKYKIELKKDCVDKTLIGTYLKLIDQTVVINTYEKERYAATHDELTGVLNRTGFFEAVDEYIERYGSKGKLMVSSNIKDFKIVNQLFGDKFGDEVISLQARIIKENLHEGGFAGRIADDKFALFIDRSYMAEEKFNDSIKALNTLTEDLAYQMHVFIGVYDPHGAEEKAQSMYDKTLMALESDKGNYSKVFSYYDSVLMDKLLSEQSILEDFEIAIDKKQIKMYLQPIIDAKNGTFGAEALCRWEHPLRGVLKPVEFLSVLEKEGLVYQLDEYIWDLAAQKLYEWKVKGCVNCYVSVNVSVKDFFYTDIFKTFMRLVEKYDIEPSSFHIEITETVLMTDFVKAFALSNKLQKAGFIVAIDNFGNGYSSLNMLKDFNAQIIKIDMTFLQNSTTSVRDQIILESIIDLSKTLNMAVVGEGVENTEQYDILRKLDCGIYQGKYLSEPLTIEEYEDKFIKYLITNTNA